MHSLRTRLFGLWLLSLIAGAAVAGLLIELYQQSADAQVARAQAVISHGCDQIQDRYGFFSAHWSGSTPELSDPILKSNLATVVGLALDHQDGVEGGIWQSSAGPLAYAFPTYEGGGPKTDLPVAEQARIQAINEEASRGGQVIDRQTTSKVQTLLFHACPLPGPIQGLTAWTMTRINVASGFWPLMLGLGVLLGLVLSMAIWLGRLLLVWARHVRSIEAALASTGPGDMHEVPLTGERELDRIVSALNDAGRRLAAARRQAATMAEQVASAERLVGLGRVAAGMAHEIRNPIAAARLQGENALAGDDARRTQAISDMLEQLDRLDTLVAELLAMTQRVTPKPEGVNLPAFLAECLSRHRYIAAERGIELELPVSEGTAVFDPIMIGRILDNLLTNGIRHAPTGGSVLVTTERTASLLIIVVEDSGPGVMPDLSAKLFEPFVTGRPDGTGLGLAIARQLADAHGGRLLLRRAGGVEPERGAAFALEIPCQRS